MKQLDGSGDYHAKWSKSYRKTEISWHRLYVWSLKKWYQWAYLQNRNRFRDLVNKFMITMGEMWRGRDRLGVWNWHVHTTIFKIKCLSMGGKKKIYSPKNQLT